MHAMRHLLRLFVPFVCVMLVSCIDGREEYWLAGDGSGHATIRYSAPASLARSCGGEQGLAKLLDEFIRRTPALTNVKRLVSCEGERMVVELQASFPSAPELVAALRRDNALVEGNLKAMVSPLIGHLNFRRDWLTVDLTRTVQPSKSLPGAFLMPAAQFEGRRLEYIVHLPMVAKETNATRTEDGGRTLIWDYSLRDGLKNNVVIHFKGTVPVPWWLLATATAVLALLGWLGLSALRKRQQQ